MIESINSSVHTDDYKHDVPFNAILWFEQATDEEIINLIECEFRGDYPADAVAEFYSNKNG